VISVVIPAHNEERVVGRLLDGLLADADAEEFDIVVVSNGSGDGTVSVAAQRAGVRVLEIEDASKHLALLAGDGAATGFPRLYVDADVELDTASARALGEALSTDGVLAVAPSRDLRLDSSAWAVRAYYQVWDRLPTVRDGLHGRGVLGVNEAGFARIADRPELIGDDLFLHSRFAPTERRVVPDSHSVVRGPRTVGDLIRRRTRAAQANTQLGTRTSGETVTTGSSGRELVRLARSEPTLWPSLAVFITVTLVARIRAWWLRRRGSAGVWLRDESSRT
jgi:glycosyltransferase involved in cell wall biosynthesis